MMIGILSADEVALAPKAPHRASDCGIKEALVDLGNWLAAPPIGDPDHVRIASALDDRRDRNYDRRSRTPSRIVA